MHERHLEDLAARARATRDSHASEDLDPVATSAVDALMVPLAADRAAAILDRVVCPTADNVIPMAHPRAGWRRGLLIAPFVLAAAAAALFMLGTRPPAPAQTDVMIAALERYDIEVLGARGVTRGDEDDLPEFTAGDSVRLRLRPYNPISVPVSAAVRAVQGSLSVPLAWTVQTITENGMLEIEGNADDVLIHADGSWALEVTVLGPDAAPLWRGQTSISLKSSRP